MSKIRHVKSMPGSSAGVHKPFISPERIPKKDTRLTTPKNKGLFGLFVCPECGASVKAKEAGAYDIDTDPTIKYMSLILSKHRVGGGAYFMIKGDVLCRGFGSLAVIPVVEEE